MLVEVICLRRDGARLPREEIEAAKPLRGYLTIDTVTMGPPVEDAVRLRKDVARLWRSDLSDTPRAVSGLECARVSRVGGNALLLVGVERDEGALAQAGHPQAWWCRVLLEPTAGEPAANGVRSSFF